MTLRIRELSADSPVPLYEVYEGDTESILHFEFIKLLTLGRRISICKNCGSFFINSGRSDKLYCDRLIENRSCKEVGASNAYKQKVKDDPILELYQRAYKRHYGKVTNNRMSKKEFFAWAEKAKFMRELAGSEKLIFQLTRIG